MFVRARIVATFGVLDLDDLGTKIGERLRTGGPRHDPCEVNDQEAIQGGWRTLCARLTVRELHSSGHDQAFLFLSTLRKTLGFIADGPQGGRARHAFHADLHDNAARRGRSRNAKTARWHKATGPGSCARLAPHNKDIQRMLFQSDFSAADELAPI